MKTLLLIGTIFLSVAARAAEASVSPYAALEWFLGGTWVATLPPKPDGTTLGIELKFDRPDNRQGLRFESAFLNGGKRAPYTCGMYAWDGAKRKFVIFYTDSSGSLNTGDVKLEGDVLAHEYTSIGAEGKIEPIRVRLTKLGADAFTNEIFVQKDGAWVNFITVRYERRN